MGFEIGILFAFGAMLSWGIGDFLIQRTTRKIGNIQTLAWIGIIGSLGLLPFVWKDFYLLKDSSNLIVMLVLGVITFIAAIFSFEAYKKGKISVIDVVLEVELPVTIALSFIFLGESLNMFQFIVILFIVFGVILIAVNSFEKFKSRVEEGVWLAIVGALFMGGVNFMTGFSSKSISPLLAIWGPWVVFTVMCIFVMLSREGHSSFFKNASSVKMLVLWTGIIDTLAWLFYALATHYNEIAIITGITESYPAIAIILGVWINKERVLPHQWFGAALAIVCSVLLSLTI